MHRVEYQIRRIADSELPIVRYVDGTERTASRAELLNMGIEHLHDDVYSCVEQHESRVENDSTGRPQRVWASRAPLPGSVVAAGDLRSRHARLPADVRPKVLRSEVFRGTADNALLLVATNLNEQLDAIAEYVGATTEPLLDPTDPETVLNEARRVAALSGNDVRRERVPMAVVDDTADIVESEGHIPHAWAGERH